MSSPDYGPNERTTADIADDIRDMFEIEMSYHSEAEQQDKLDPQACADYRRTGSTVHVTLRNGRQFKITVEELPTS